MSRRTIGYRVRVRDYQIVVSDLTFLIGTIPNTRERADIEYARMKKKHTNPGDVVELFEVEEVKTEQFNLIRQSKPIPTKEEQNDTTGNGV